MPKTDIGRFFAIFLLKGVEKGLKNKNPLIFSGFLCPKSGDGGSRTLVQTRNPHGFYMLIPLLVFVPCKGANALNATLSPKASPCCRSADKAIPKLLSTPGSGRNQESPPAGCLVRPPCERIKPVIYCTSIRQRERSCFRQLNLVRAVIKESAINAPRAYVPHQLAVKSSQPHS